MRVVLDTNIVLRWVLPQQDEDGKALLVRNSIINHKVEAYILNVLLYEVQFVLKKRPEFHHYNPLRITEEIRKHIFSLPILIESLYVVDLEKAVDLAIKNDTNLFDSSYYIFAKQINGILITGDEKFANKFLKDKTVCLLRNFKY